MKDMQATGSNLALFSHNLSELISATNYYLKSGYFSPKRCEINQIYSFYTELSNMILRAKSNIKSTVNRYELYDNYCKLRQMLKSEVFINVTLIGSEEFSMHHSHGLSQHFSKVVNLYHKCIDSFPCDNTLCQLANDDPVSFYKRDVFIGVLRNRTQLDICLEKGFYHIPAENLPVPVEDVSCIAIYQSKNLFGDSSCIKYYGKVDSYTLLKRSEITEIPKKSDKPYYKFVISNWQKLPEPISNSGGGKVFETTSQYLLFTSKDVCELNFKDLNVCKLYRTIRNSILSGRDKVACRYRNITFALENNTLSTYSNRVRHYCVSTEEYLKNPSKHFWSMLKSVKNNKQ